MKIYIDQIHESGLTLTKQYSPESLDLDRGDIKFTEPIDVSAFVFKGSHNLAIDAKIQGVMRLSCDRCLEDFTLPFLKQAKLNLFIENKTEIDITDNLREEIILSYPLKTLCKPDCLGLCVSCGKNLNREKCSCKPRS